LLYAIPINHKGIIVISTSFGIETQDHSRSVLCLTASLLLGPPRQCNGHWWQAYGPCQRGNSRCVNFRISDVMEKILWVDVRYTLDELGLMGDFSTLVNYSLLRTEEWGSALSSICGSVALRSWLTSQVLRALRLA
jgi:hypothetical protein